MDFSESFTTTSSDDRRVNARRVETLLAFVTLGSLGIYAPVETIYSWAGGLTDPYYVVDVIAMGLMLWGAIRSLRARPRRAPGLVTVGWAWAGANFWRALFDRLKVDRTAGRLDFGSVELRFVAAELIVALLCLALGVVLIVRASNDSGNIPKAVDE